MQAKRSSQKSTPFPEEMRKHHEAPNTFGGGGGGARKSYILINSRALFYVRVGAETVYIFIEWQGYMVLSLRGEISFQIC